MSRVFVTRLIPGPGLGRLRALHEVDVWAERLPPSPDQLRSRAGAAEGLLTMLTDDVDAELLAAAPGLVAISNYAVGLDNIDLAAARERGIPVGHTPGVLTDATADLTLALILAGLRRIPAADRAVRAGEWLTWEPAFLLGRELYRATVLVIGAGRIGRAVTRRLTGFDARVLTAGRDDDLLALLPEADVVSLHCPLTPATRGLIGARELTAMKRTALLVNTARGPIVDSDDLVDALCAGEIAGAALDVTDPEPLPSNHPLLGVPGLVVVPHLGSATHAARAAMTDIAVDNLLAALRGEEMPHVAPA